MAASGNESERSAAEKCLRYCGPGGMATQLDAALCNDMLMTEKYVADAYNTAIFGLLTQRAAGVESHSKRNSNMVKAYSYMHNNGM
jgi:hypothetical protein